MFADLIYPIRIIQEALKVEDKNGWQRLKKHLLARLARAGVADLHGLSLRDVRQCILNSVYRIRLRKTKGLKVSH
jgi:hypothetical protein